MVEPPPMENNQAVTFFLGDSSPQNPSHLHFNTWYHPNVCHFLLQLAPNQSKCIRVMFSDAGYGNNTQTFKDQLKQLVILANSLQRPAIFISKEPGADNHYICGLIKEDKLLLINPLGITTKNDCYQTIFELKQEKTLSNIWFSSNPLQKHEYEEEGLVSCGAITSEIAIHILSRFTLQTLTEFWCTLKTHEPTTHEKTRLIYYGMNIANLLSENLTALLHVTNKVTYENLVRGIRQSHFQWLTTLPENNASSERISIDEYLKKCKESTPAQVIFNRLVTNDKSIVDVMQLPEYHLLQKEISFHSSKPNNIIDDQTIHFRGKAMEKITQVDSYQIITKEQIQNLLQKISEKYQGNEAQPESDNELLHQEISVLLGLSFGEMADFVQRVRLKALGQILEIDGSAVEGRKYPEITVDYVEVNTGKEKSNVKIPDFNDESIIQFAGWHPLEYLIYNLYFLIELHTRIKLQKLTIPESLEVDKDIAEKLLAHEIWVCSNSYKICKVYKELLKDKKISALEKLMEGYLNSIKNASPKEYEFCLPCGYKAHADYLVLVYSREEDLLHIRVDNSSKGQEDAKYSDELYTEFYPLNLKNSEIFKKVLERLKKVCEFTEKDQNEANTIIYGYDKIFIKQEKKQLPLKKQDIPNCVVEGYWIGMWHRLYAAIQTRGYKFFYWILKQNNFFVVELHEVSSTNQKLRQLSTKMLNLSMDSAYTEPRRRKNKRIIDNLKKFQSVFKKFYSQYQITNILTGQGLKIKELSVETEIVEHDNLIIKSGPQQASQQDFDYTKFLEAFDSIDDSAKRINLNNIFSMINNTEAQAYKILILGEPGVGKTTLTYQVAYKWAKEKNDQKGLVLHISLTFIKTYTATLNFPTNNEDLAKFIVHCYLSRGYDLETQGVTIKALSELLSNNQLKIVIILDGLDEVAATNNLAHRNLLDKILARNYLIICSRPYFVQTLKSLPDKILINLGFEKNTIQEYIEKFFGNSKADLNKFTQLMNSESTVSSLCRNPFCLELICTLYRNDPKLINNQATLANIYSLLNIKLMRNYFTRIVSDTTIFSSDKTIINNAKKDGLYLFLSKLAYVNFIKNNYIFELDENIVGLLTLDGKEKSNFILNIIQSGFIKPLIQDYFKDNESNKLYTFLHLSIQEYYASEYIVQILKEKDKHKNDDKELLNIRQTINENRSNLIYINVFKFVIGILIKDKLFDELAYFLRSIFQKETELTLFGFTVYLNCFNEIKNNTEIVKKPSIQEIIETCVFNLKSIFTIKAQSEKHKYKIKKIILMASKNEQLIDLKETWNEIYGYFEANFDIKLMKLFFPRKAKELSHIIKQKISTNPNILSDLEIEDILSVSHDYLSKEEIEKLWEIVKARIIKLDNNSARKLELFLEYSPNSVLHFFKSDFLINKLSNSLLNSDFTEVAKNMLKNLMFKLGSLPVFKVVAFLVEDSISLEKYTKADIVSSVLLYLTLAMDKMTDDSVKEALNIAFQAYKSYLDETKRYGIEIFELLLDSNFQTEVYRYFFSVLQLEAGDNIKLCLEILKKTTRKKSISFVSSILVKEGNYITQSTWLSILSEIEQEHKDEFIKSLDILKSVCAEAKNFLLPFIVANFKHLGTLEITSLNEVLNFSQKKFEINLNNTYHYLLSKLESENYLVSLNAFNSLYVLLQSFPSTLAPLLVEEIKKEISSAPNKKINLLVSCLDNDIELGFKLLKSLTDTKLVNWPIISRVSKVLIKNVSNSERIFEILKPFIDEQNTKYLFVIFDLLDEKRYLEILTHLQPILDKNIFLINNGTAWNFINKLIDRFPDVIFNWVSDKNIFESKNFKEILIYFEIFAKIAKLRPDKIFQNIDSGIDKFIEDLYAELKRWDVKDQEQISAIQNIFYGIKNVFVELISKYSQQMINHIQHLLSFDNFDMRAAGIGFVESLIEIYPDKALDLISILINKYRRVTRLEVRIAQLLVQYAISKPDRVLQIVNEAVDLGWDNELFLVLKSDHLIQTYPKQVLTIIEKMIENKKALYISIILDPSPFTQIIPKYPQDILRIVSKAIQAGYGFSFIPFLKFLHSNYFNEVLDLVIEYYISHPHDAPKNTEIQHKLFKKKNMPLILDYFSPILLNENINDDKKRAIISILSKFDCTNILTKELLVKLTYEEAKILFLTTPFSSLISHCKKNNNSVYFYPLIINQLLIQNHIDYLIEHHEIIFSDNENNKRYELELSEGDSSIFTGIRDKLKQGFSLEPEDFRIKHETRCVIF